jgi:hypothetical protein
MLPLPENDYSRAQVLASWIELSALGEDDGAAYRGYALEAMRDSQLYPERTSGKEADSSDPNSPSGMLAETWRVLRSRERMLRDAWPFELSEDAVKRRSKRKRLADVAAYSAMLLIEAASLKWYSRIAITSGDPIRHWFERIVVAALSRFSNGRTMRFGAPFPAGWPSSFVGRVQHLASAFDLSSRKEEIEKLSSPAQQDDSLDVVARLRICDELGGVPYVLVQCATGANWSSDKPSEPRLPVWEKYISWDGPRLKALALPFTLRERGELEKASIRHFNALVLDRIRIAGALPDENIDVDLRKKLSDWCSARFASIRDATPATVPKRTVSRRR